MPVPNTFANATATIPLSQLDANFATTITLGNTAIQLGNTVSTLNNMTLANVTVTSGNVTLTNVTVTTANVTNATITTANVTTANIATEVVTTSQTLSYGAANGIVYLNGSKVSTTGASLTFDGTNFATTGSVTSAGASNSGNLAFTGTGNRITGDFSNATLANRVMFQTSTANSATIVEFLPSGSGTVSGVNFGSSSDLANTSILSVSSLSTDARFNAGFRGTGTYLPMTFFTGGSERMRVDTSGNVGIGTSSPAYKLQANAGSSNNNNDANTIVATGTNHVRLKVHTPTTGGFRASLVLSSDEAVTATGNEVSISTTGSDEMQFATGGSERARINSSGMLFMQSSTANGVYMLSGADFSMASGATVNIIGLTAGAAMILVYEPATGDGGMFWANFSAVVTKIAGDGSATDAGSTIAVYKNAASHTTTIKNRYAVTKNFRIAVYSAQAQP